MAAGTTPTHISWPLPLPLPAATRGYPRRLATQPTHGVHVRTCVHMYAAAGGAAAGHPAATVDRRLARGKFPSGLAT
eukprot:SAG25_NODE_1388_length_3144_cov_1.629885_1_plen_76_part_10